jgi:exodeoxyribonuclease VII large subunit
MSPTRTIYTVREITAILRRALDSDPKFRGLWVQGEISNFVRATSGYIYFTLKDAHSQIKVAIFKPNVFRFPPQNGDEVLVRGKLDIYDQRSEYQIIVDTVEPVGAGALQLAYERLKAKLDAEGLFDDNLKKPLPKFPRRIGVVTSATGAAIQDILRTLEERYPAVEVLLCPTLVQGEGAAEQIAHAIGRLNQIPGVDVLIVGRGGGSIEDLWPFNEEIVARAIFDSDIPVVSAVGHETDYTISDAVADERALTPTDAATLVVPDQQDLRWQLDEYQRRLVRNITHRIESEQRELTHLQARIAHPRQIDVLNRFHQTVDQFETQGQRAMRDGLSERAGRLERLYTELVHRRPTPQIQELRHKLNELTQRLESAITEQITGATEAWRVASSRLDALSPLATLARGYSVCQNAEGATVTDVSQVEVGERVDVQLARGSLECKIERID